MALLSVDLNFTEQPTFLIQIRNRFFIILGMPDLFVVLCWDFDAKWRCHQCRLSRILQRTAVKQLFLYQMGRKYGSRHVNNHYRTRDGIFSWALSRILFLSFLFWKFDLRFYSIFEPLTFLNSPWNIGFPILQRWKLYWKNRKHKIELQKVFNLWLGKNRKVSPVFGKDCVKKSQLKTEKFLRFLVKTALQNLGKRPRKL